jgi:hypothetical protein
VDPGNFSHSSHNLRVVITGEDFTTADNIGVGKKGSFTDRNLENVVYVFSRFRMDSQHGTPGTLRSLDILGMTASHEAGHAFGLEHQALFEGDTLIDPQHPGSFDKGFIMGQESEISRRTVWTVGKDEFGAHQDDMAIIASAINGFGFRPDEIGTTFAEPEQLTKYDATLGALVGSGVISTTSDTDVFRFDWGGGLAIIQLSTGTAGHFGSANLDAVLELFRGGPSVTLVERDAPTFSLDCSIVENLPAGVYFLKVGSQGEIGDVGQYNVSVIDPNGPRVLSTKYASLGTNLAGAWITFNKAIDAATFTTADIKASGANVLSIVQDNDPWRFLITVAPTSTTGYWNLTVGPNISDRYGNLMDQNRDGELGQANDVFYFDSLQPALGGTSTPPKRTRIGRRSVDLAFARL